MAVLVLLFHTVHFPNRDTFIPIVIPAGYILRLDPIKWRLTYATRVFVPWVAFTLTRA